MNITKKQFQAIKKQGNLLERVEKIVNDYDNIYKIDHYEVVYTVDYPRIKAFEVVLVDGSTKYSNYPK